MQKKSDTLLLKYSSFFLGWTIFPKSRNTYFENDIWRILQIFTGKHSHIKKTVKTIFDIILNIWNVRYIFL